jgi:hypothetical protein
LAPYGWLQLSEQPATVEVMLPAFKQSLTQLSMDWHTVGPPSLISLLHFCSWTQQFEAVQVSHPMALTGVQIRAPSALVCGPVASVCASPTVASPLSAALASASPALPASPASGEVDAAVFPPFEPPQPWMRQQMAVDRAAAEVVDSKLCEYISIPLARADLSVRRYEAKRP